MMRYCPVPSVTADRVFSMSAGLAASTVTPGSTAPDASRTVPVTDACANRGTGSSRRTTNARHVDAVRIGRVSFYVSLSVLFGNAFLAELDDADRFDDAVGRGHRQAAVGHHRAQQRRGLGPRDCGLDAGAHEAIGVVEGLPRMARDRRHVGVGVATAAVAAV